MRAIRLVHREKARFWEVHWESAEAEVTQGALGTRGRSTARGFRSPAEAGAWVEAQVRQKRTEGFGELAEELPPRGVTLPDPQLLEHILLHPDDDGPRLVYADQLTAAGDPLGELITVQVALARAPEGDPSQAMLRHRSVQLVERFRSRWSGGLRGVTFHFERGFAAEATLALEDLAAHAPRLWTVAPLLQRVTVSGQVWLEGEAAMQALLRQPQAARLTSLALHGCPPSSVRPLAGARHLERLQHLALRRCGLSDLEALSVLGAPHLAGLTRLDLRGNTVAGRCMEVVVRRPLAELRLGGNRLGRSSVSVFSHASALAGLHTLELSSNGIGDVGLGVLGGGTWWTRLEVLELSDVSATAAGVAALSRGPLAGTVHTLDLSRNPLQPEGVDALVEGRWPALRHLDLSGAMVGDAGVRRLVQLPAAGRLESLALRKDALTDAAVQTLVGAAPSFPALRWLSLSGNLVGPEARPLLKRAFPAAHVVVGGGFTPRTGGTR